MPRRHSRRGDGTVEPGAEGTHPWLEEFVVVAEEIERLTRLRVQLGGAPPEDEYAATRHRLRAETALVKAKRTL